MDSIARILEFVCELLRMIADHRQIKKQETQEAKDRKRAHIEFERNRIREGDRRRIESIARRLRIKQ